MSISGIHTQATNFMDFIKTGVDARTGQFTIAFQLPLLPANGLAGPSLSPTLSFNVLASTVDRGFGYGWALGFSEINLQQTSASLQLSSGESFAIDIKNTDFSPGNELLLLDNKLKSMVITCQSDTEVRIDHKSGQTEILTKQHNSAKYLLTELRSPEGRRMFVDWSAFANDDFRLDKIRDETRTLLAVQSDGAEVVFQVPGHEARTLSLQLTNDMLGSVYLPGIDQPFTVTYEAHPVSDQLEILLPTELTSPLGASDSVRWGTGEFGHQLPPSAPFPELPRVIEWKHSSGTGDVELTRSYEWVGALNFLGFGSEHPFDWQTGRDNLYAVQEDYNYEVIETLTDEQERTLSTTTRTWNRFHLLTSEVTRRGQCEIRNTTTYGIETGKHWEDQPAWCQLPHLRKTTFIDHSATNLQRSEETEYRYDTFGNVLFTRTPDGIEEHSEYYPAEGVEATEESDGCPASPLGLVRFLKKKTVKPALVEDGTYGGASETSTTYAYKALDSTIEGGLPFVVVQSERVRDETHSRDLETTTQTYITEKGPHYARVSEKVITLNGKATTTSYRYELTNDELSTHTTVTGFEGTDLVRATQSSSRSLITGQLTRERNQAGVLSRYEYDALGRVTKAVNADDSPYQTQMTSSYHVKDKVAIETAAEGENPVMIEQVLATGQRRRQWLDGEGRAVRIELQDIDHAPDEFREIARTVFDAEGRTISETQQDWLRAPENPATVTALTLTTTFEYDDWGQVRQTTSPDGVQTCNEHDPVALTLKAWQQNGSLQGPQTMTRHNAAGSPIKEQLYDSEGTLIRTKEWVRDGLDRVTQTTIKVPGQQDRVTSLRLDVYGRVLEQRLADDTVVNWTYALHSDANHPETIAVTPSSAEQSQAAPFE